MICFYTIALKDLNLRSNKLKSMPQGNFPTKFIIQGANDPRKFAFILIYLCLI